MLVAVRDFGHQHLRFERRSAASQQAEALVRRLRSRNGLVSPRAALFRDEAARGVRQALLLYLGAPLSDDTVLGSLRGFWLVEQENRKVFLYGSDRPPVPGRISGRVVRDLPVLEPDSAWLQRVARSVAARVLRAATRDVRVSDQDLQLLTQAEHALLSAALRAFLDGLDQILSPFFGEPF